MKQLFLLGISFHSSPSRLAPLNQRRHLPLPDKP